MGNSKVQTTLEKVDWLDVCPPFFLNSKIGGMNMYFYIALKNPNGAKQVINSYGQRAIRNPKALAGQLAECVNRNGREALDRVAMIHPDRTLFVASHREDNPMSEAFSRVDGQALKAEVDALRNGTNSEQKGANKEGSKLDTMVMAGVILIGLALVLKK